MSAGKGPDWYNELDLDKVSMLAACRDGDCQAAQMYLTKNNVDIDEGDDDDVTALQIAAAAGHLDLVSFFFMF